MAVTPLRTRSLKLCMEEAPPTLRELALERLRTAIVEHHFPPGTRLAEREQLVRTYGSGEDSPDRWRDDPVHLAVLERLSGLPTRRAYVVKSAGLKNSRAMSPEMVSASLEQGAHQADRIFGAPCGIKMRTYISMKQRYKIEGGRTG